MDVVFFAYLGSAMVAVIAVFAAIRWIDFGFTKVEDRRWYKMAKGCINAYNKGQGHMYKALTRDMTKTINNAIFEMANKLEDL